MDVRTGGTYRLEHRELVAEGSDLRVQVPTLAEGQCVPWHFHSEIADSFVGLEGVTRIETRDPDRDPGSGSNHLPEARRTHRGRAEYRAPGFRTGRRGLQGHGHSGCRRLRLYSRARLIASDAAGRSKVPDRSDASITDFLHNRPDTVWARLAPAFSDYAATHTSSPELPIAFGHQMTSHAHVQRYCSAQ